jgi:hypothetical protein
VERAAQREALNAELDQLAAGDGGETAPAILHHAVDLGVRHIDTRVAVRLGAVRVLLFFDQFSQAVLLVARP